MNTRIFWNEMIKGTHFQKYYIWPKSKTLRMPNVIKDVELLCIALGMKTVTLEDRLAVSYEAKTLVYNLAFCISWYLPKGVEKILCTWKPAHECLLQLYS